MKAESAFEKPAATLPPRPKVVSSEPSAIEPADRALAAAIGPLATADEDLAVGLQGEGVVELSVTERGDPLGPEHRVDAEIGVETQHEAGRCAAVGRRRAACRQQQPLAVRLLEHRVEAGAHLGEAEDPGRTEGDVETAVGAEVDESQARAAAGVADRGPDEDAAVGLDRHASAVSVPGETLAVTSPPVPKVVSRVPSVFRRSRASFPDVRAGDDDLAIRRDGDADNSAEVRERDQRHALLAEAGVRLPRASVRTDDHGGAGCPGRHDLPVGLDRDDAGRRAPREERHALCAKRRVEVARADPAGVVERQRGGGKTPSVAPPLGLLRVRSTVWSPWRLRPGLIRAIVNWRLVTPGPNEIEPESGVYLPARERRAIRGREMDRDGPLAPPSRTSVIVAVPAFSSTVEFAARTRSSRPGAGCAAGIDFDRGCAAGQSVVFRVGAGCGAGRHRGERRRRGGAARGRHGDRLRHQRVGRREDECAGGQHGRGVRGRDRQRHGDVGDRHRLEHDRERRPRAPLHHARKLRRRDRDSLDRDDVQVAHGDTAQHGAARRRAEAERDVDGGRGVGIVRIGMATVAVADPTANATVVFTGV